MALNNKAIGKILLCIPRQFLRILALRINRLIQQVLRFIPVKSIEDGANALRHRLALIEVGDIRLRILLQVKLAALPENATYSHAPLPVATACRNAAPVLRRG